MRLVVECEHGYEACVHSVFQDGLWLECVGGTEITDPDAILAALAEEDLLEIEHTDGRVYVESGGRFTRFVSPWKEAE